MRRLQAGAQCDGAQVCQPADGRQDRERNNGRSVVFVFHQVHQGVFAETVEQERRGRD